MRHHFLRRAPSVLGLSLALVALTSSAALACGGLVSPTGAVQLQRTTTLVGYVGGVEHYVTSFEFGTAEESFGAIIPLPDVPTVVERAGDWTLQRSLIEVGSFEEEAREGSTSLPLAASADSVEVLLETTVDALDITVLRGGGADVAQWAEENGFVLSDDAPEVLEFYSSRSPIFLAARFDAAEATARGFIEGDGIPIHLGIPTDNPWVPLRILSLGKVAEEVVEADVFLLTPVEPTLLHGDGLRELRSEPADQAYLDDIRSDANSGWVPGSAWFTHLGLEVEAQDLTYDLAIEAFGGAPDPADAAINFVPAPPPGGNDDVFGDAPSALTPNGQQPPVSSPSSLVGAQDQMGLMTPVWLVIIGALAGAALLGGGILIGRRQSKAPTVVVPGGYPPLPPMKTLN